MNHRIVAVALAAGVLALPAVAAAAPHHGKGHEKQAATGHHGKREQPKSVMFVFKGRFTAPGTLDVVSGDSHVRKGGFVGHAVAFDFTSAKVVAADVNGDNRVDVTDVKDGDVVLVQARVAKHTQYAQGADAIAARKLVDRTNPHGDDDRDGPASDDSAAS